MYNQTEYLIWKNFGKSNVDKMNLKNERNAQDGRESAHIKLYQFQNKKFANILFNYVNLDDDMAVHSVT